MIKEEFDIIHKDFRKFLREIKLVLHLKPISSYSGEHLVIPTEDLRPLCSNCHSMVHRRKPIPWDVEKVEK